MYNQTVSKIQGSKLALNIPAALITWFILSIGVNSFVDLNANILSRFATGALLGGVVYGVFNGTNKAIFEDYDTTTALYDTAWGMFVTGTVSAAAGLFV